MSRVLCSAMLRIKNEDRWIRSVIESIYPLCHRIFVLDDHSTDDTVAICESFPNVTVFESPFDSLDESRDKNWLYGRILDQPEYQPSKGGFHWPHWLLCIDGDEILDPRDVSRLFAIMHENTDAVGLRFKIMYLWNSMTTRRVDGVYRNFARPSAFRIINPAFRFQSTPWGNGANFHCSSIPQELLHYAIETDVRLNHTGYMHAKDRVRKWKWYNSIDPMNPTEGYDPRFPERGAYPHIVQGDLPEVPADARLMHAGPLELETIA